MEDKKNYCGKNKLIKILIFIVKENYRRTNFNNFFLNKKYGKYRVYLLNKEYISVLRPIVSLLNYLNLLCVIYTDKEYLNRDREYRLWWNDINELNQDIIKNKKNIFICTSPLVKLNSLQFFPQEIKKIQNQLKEILIVFIGEVDLKIEKEIINLWEKKKEDILRNINIINEEEFWENEDFKSYSIKEKQNIFKSFNNLIRYEGVLFLKENFKNFELVGNDWVTLKLTEKKSNHDRDFRRNKYYSNLCPDFGSKSGDMSLFHRTIEIIESGGIPIQVKRKDSEEVYGQEICRYIIFKNFYEMKEKIIEILNNKKLIIHINNLLKNREKEFRTMQVKALNKNFN